MFNLDITNENKTEHNKKQPYMSHQPYRMFQE